MPGSDVPDESTGLKINPTGGIATVDGVTSIRQAIGLLLSTTPGERVMRPDYGCYLGRLAFAPNDDTTAGLAIHYARQALERWEPRIRILKLQADPSPESPERLDIYLEYELRTTAEVNSLEYALMLSGES